MSVMIKKKKIPNCTLNFFHVQFKGMVELRSLFLFQNEVSQKFNSPSCGIVLHYFIVSF